MSKRSNQVIDNALKFLAKYLETKDLIELIINQPGEIWLETRSGWIVKNDPKISREYLHSMGRNLATVNGQVFDEEHPLLSCTLPAPYHYRVQMVGEQINDHGFGVAIRVGAAMTLPLSAWFGDRKLSEHSGLDGKREKESFLDENLTVEENILRAIKHKKNILVAGGTSSGKTTFLNSILKLVDPDERIITIEDAKELVIDQPNNMRFLKAKGGTDIAKVTYVDLINTAMRSRPDRIILGELDIQNTLPFLRILNTGHGGSMATVHADGVEEAIEAISLNVSLSGAGGGDAEAITKYVRKAIDIVVHLHRADRSTYEATIKEIS